MPRPRPSAQRPVHFLLRRVLTPLQLLQFVQRLPIQLQLGLRRLQASRRLHGGPGDFERGLPDGIIQAGQRLACCDTVSFTHFEAVDLPHLGSGHVDVAVGLGEAIDFHGSCLNRGNCQNQRRQTQQTASSLGFVESTHGIAFASCRVPARSRPQISRGHRARTVGAQTVFRLSHT